MQTTNWGPSAWDFLHSITFAYPIDPSPEDKIYYKSFFNNIQFVLPCNLCRQSFTILFKYITIDPYLDSREGLTYWLFIIHNLVNIKLKSNLESFKNVVIKYENKRSKCGASHNLVYYNECISKLKEVVLDDVKTSIVNCCNKYKIISRNQIRKLYNSKEYYF